MIKKILLFAISIFLVACTDQTLIAHDVIALGVIRTSFNLRDSYVVDIYGSGSVKLELPAKLGSDPEWSPNGEWIISSTQYQVRQPKESEIYLMRSDGSHRRLVAHHTGGAFHPAWSPDGKKIAYFARDDQVGIYILDIECFKASEQKCNSVPNFVNFSDYAAPDWSPDGNFLVYEQKGTILVIPSNGHESPKNITPNISNCNDPKWSPDGLRIVFSCYLPDQFDIFIANADGSDLKNLTSGAGSNIQPLWSPDGSKIAFISTRNNLGQIIGDEDTVRSNAIFIMNNDGNEIFRLSLRDDEHVLWYTWLSR